MTRRFPDLNDKRTVVFLPVFHNVIDIIFMNHINKRVTLIGIKEIAFRFDSLPGFYGNKIAIVVKKYYQPCYYEQRSDKRKDISAFGVFQRIAATEPNERYSDQNKD